MKEDISELLPCPFCGEKPDMNESEPSTLHMNEGAVHFAISCSDFGCDVAPKSMIWHITPENAAKAWNQRHITIEVNND